MKRILFLIAVLLLGALSKLSGQINEKALYHFEEAIKRTQTAELSGVPLASSSVLAAMKLDSALYYDRNAPNWDYSKRQVFMYNPLHKVSSWEYYEWDSPKSKWSEKEKIDYVEDNNGFPKTKTLYTWEDVTSKWLGDQMEEYVYRSNGSIEEEVKSIWDRGSSKWIPDTRTIHNYDTARQRNVGRTRTKWDDNAKVWVNFEKYQEFFTQTPIDSSVTTAWDTTLLSWVNQSASKFIWDTTGPLAEIIGYQWSKDSSRWDYAYKSKYMYNTMGRRVSYRLWLRDVLSMQLYLFQSSTTTYTSAGDPFVELDSTYDFILKKLIPDDRTTSYYDSNNSLQSEIIEQWNEASATWEKYLKVDHKEDSRHLQNDILRRPATTKSLFLGRSFRVIGLPLSATEFIHDGSSWVPIYRAEYYYTQVNTSITPVNGPAWELYPNPNTGDFQIKGEFNEFPIELSIYDLNGKKVHQSRLTNNLSDLNLQLAEGMYLVKCQGTTKRFIILR